jgi:acetamidase/formamidase
MGHLSLPLLITNQSEQMKNANSFLLLILFMTAGCNSQTAEEAVQGYVSKTLNDFRDQLPEELKQIDSLLLDSGAIKRKIAETTNLDSLAKYNDLLTEAKNLLKKDISPIDSIVRKSGSN